WQRPRRRDQEGAQCRRLQGEDVRILQPGRGRFFRHRLAAEARADRPRLCRQLSAGSRADPASDARARPEDGADGRRPPPRSSPPTRGADAEGALIPSRAAPGNNPAAKAVVERFVANKVDPEGYTLHTYAAIQVWAQAVAKVGATDARKVMETVKAGEWDTV